MSIFIAKLFTIAKCGSKVPIGRQSDKENVVYRQCNTTQLLKIEKIKSCHSNQYG